jgi:tetratricopeptide (TPR) repeat protein
MKQLRAFSLLFLLAACGGPKVGPPPTTPERLNAEAVRRLDRGDDAGAEEMIRAALREAELVDDLVGQAEAWNNLGALEMARGKYREAWSAHATALALHQSTRVRGVGEVRTRANLGSALLASGKVSEARTQFEEAVTLGDKIGEPKAARLAKVGLASVALRDGDASRALALSRSALDGSGDAAEGGAFAVQGAAEEALHDWTGARAAYERALDIDRKHAVPRAVAEDLRGLARVAESAGNAAEATALLTRSSRIARRLGERGVALRDLERALELSGPAPTDAKAALEAELRELRQTPP